MGEMNKIKAVMSNAERHLLSICMKLYHSTSGDYHVAALLIMTVLLGSFY